MTPRIPAKLIMTHAAQVRGCSFADLVDPSRRRPLVLVRALAVWCARRLCPNIARTSIARILQRDPTSVRNLEQKAGRLMVSDDDFRADALSVLHHFRRWQDDRFTDLQTQIEATRNHLRALEMMRDACAVGQVDQPVLFEVAA